MAVPTLTQYQNGVNQVSGSQLNTMVQTANNVAALRTLTGLTNMQVDLQGFTVASDGGQGSFYWNPTSTAADDNGVSTVVPNGVMVGAWLRIGATGTGTNSLANFNAITGYLPVSISGSNTTAAVTISQGAATDSTNAINIITGGTNGWAVSNGNALNGYQGGTTLPNSSTIHFFFCANSSGVNTGSFASTSLTPTLPSGSTYYRRIFSFNTNSSGAPISYTAIETEGGSYLSYLTTQLLDVSANNLGTTRVAYTLTVPQGIKLEPKIRAYSSSSGENILLTSGDETDVAPAGSVTVPLWDINSGTATFTGMLTTNTSGQIGARSTQASTSIAIVTRGFKDWRRN